MDKGGIVMGENRNKLPILEANILYLIIAIMLITMGAKAQSNEIYTGLLITEYIIVLLPVLIYLILRNYSLKDSLRLNQIGFIQSVKIIFIVLFAYPIAVFFNFIGIMILSRFVEIIPNAVPLPTTASEYIVSFLVIALTPGICEEVMFRGVMMRSYHSLGKRKAIIYSAILFGLFHFNLQNLLGPIFLGILFGLIGYKTNSLYSTIIGHTVNNTIALTIGYLANDLEQNLETSIDTTGFAELDGLFFTFISLGIIALLFGFIVYKLVQSLTIYGERETMEFESFIKPYSLMEDIVIGERMSSLEKIPILLVILIFVVWNYNYFFI